MSRLKLPRRHHQVNHGRRFDSPNPPTPTEDIGGEKRKSRRDTNMLLGPGSVICTVCNASYESETKLREHQRTAHRGVSTEEDGSQIQLWSSLKTLRF
jgi:hypothetical protein